MIITATTVINHAFRSIRALDRGWLVISLRKNLLAVVGLAITARTTERGGRVPFFFSLFLASVLIVTYVLRIDH